MSPPGRGFTILKVVKVDCVPCLDSFSIEFNLILGAKAKSIPSLSIIHNQQQLHWEKVLENFKEWTFCNGLKGFHEREVEKRCVLLGLRTLWKDVCHTFLKPCHSNSDCNKKMCPLVNTFLFKPIKTVEAFLNTHTIPRMFLEIFL